MVTPSQIIKGEVKYTLEEFYSEMKNFTYQIKESDTKKKEKGFYSLFLFLMLSAEDKSVETMMEAFYQTKEQVLECQEAFKEQIDICRAIHMKKFLDILNEYMAPTSMILEILNLWIKDFIKSHLPQEENVAA